MKKMILPVLAFCSASSGAFADEFEAAMQAYVADHIASWSSDPSLVAAIRAQNAETAPYNQAKIDELDIIWRAQVGTSGASLVESKMTNPAADFLRQQVEATDGAITEAFIMDGRGLNVAVSHPTSDYWQGDEAKFTQTYLLGPDGVHYSEIALDQSTQTVQGQVSMTIVDDATGEAIGALTVGINLTALM